MMTNHERSILRVLLKKRIWLNTTQITNLTKMSWNTALKYLQKLYNRGWISKKGNYWRARR